METNNNKEEDILNSLLKTNYIDLSNVETNNLTQLNTDDILKESQRLVNDAVKSKTIEEYAPNNESEEKEVKEQKKESSTPSLKINTSTEASIVEEDEIPSKYLSNPIDFVNYIEYQLPKEKMKIKKNTFILKKFENEKTTKFCVSELNPQEDLGLLMLRGDVDITTAMAHEDNIITGDILGDIKFYSLKDKKLARTLPCPIKKRSQVNSIDLSDDGDYAFAGFANGNIALYELTTNKCKLINNTAHKTSCINVKFIERIEKKTFRIFSSDIEGNVLDIVIKSGCGIIIGDVKGDVTSKGNGPISVYGNIYGSARSTNGAIQVSGHVDIARSTNGSILVGRNNELTKISDVLKSVNNLLK